MPLHQLITALLEQDIIEDSEHGKSFICHCSMTHIKRGSLRKHLLSKVHKTYVDFLDEGKTECGICYEMKGDFWTCDQCKNGHCAQCHSNIKTGKCPFCRHRYENANPYHLAIHAVDFFEPPFYYSSPDSEHLAPPPPPPAPPVSSTWWNADWDDLPPLAPTLERQDAQLLTTAELFEHMTERMRQNSIVLEYLSLSNLF